MTYGAIHAKRDWTPGLRPRGKKWGQKPSFPRDAVALDSWATHYLIHDTPGRRRSAKSDKQNYPDVIDLAHGKCRCKKSSGRKGMPICYVPWDNNSDNINVFQESFLSDRGCSIVRGDHCYIISPRGTIYGVQMWGTLPYLTTLQLDTLISDLPKALVIGRTGSTAVQPPGVRMIKEISS